MVKPVEKVIEVKCAPETAFRVFTQDLDRWWPKDRHSLSAMEGGVARAISLEAGAGGEIVETAHDGKHHHWGSITRYEPPKRLTIDWHIGRPKEEATIVDVVFTPVEGGTRVQLTHHGWEALGDEAATMREGYNKGWVSVFEEAFAQACARQTA